MAFKLIKIAALITVGMMLAPKKGSELRADFVKMVKRHNKQLKAMVNKIEIVWEKSKGVESDEVAADIELRIREVKGAVSILDSASTKEMAYKTLKKLDSAAVNVVKAAAKSPNVRSVAKDLAKMTVSVIDSGVKVYNDLKKTTASIADRVIEEGDDRQPEDKVININSTVQKELLADEFEEDNASILTGTSIEEEAEQILSAPVKKTNSRRTTTKKGK